MFKTCVPRRLKPIFLDSLAEYRKRDLYKDALAGMMTAMVALPLAVAFAIASGVRPEQGVYTAIIAGSAIAIFGGCRFQVSGPTGAFVVLVAATVADIGYEGLAVATVLAGAMVLLAGVLGAGRLQAQLPEAAVYGFTAGIAILIALTQAEAFLGVTVVGSQETFEKMKHIALLLPEASSVSVGLGLLTVLVMLLSKRYVTSLPAPLVAVLTVSSLTAVLGLEVATINSRFGQLPTSLPTPTIPQFELLSSFAVWKAALFIALLGGIESLLSASVADKLTRTESRYDAELLGLGIGNMLSACFLGICATGAFARTATNIKSGAVSPASAVFHAVFLLMVLLWLGPIVGQIPMTVLAGVLLVTAWHMAQLPELLRRCKHSIEEGAIVVTAFAFTLAVDLITGLAAGVIMSSLWRYSRKRSIKEEAV